MTINPDAILQSGEFFFSSSEHYELGDIVRRGAEENDACLFASSEIDHCMVLDGWHGAVYRVRGTTCRHYWPMGVSYSIKAPSGGFWTGATDLESFPRSVLMFDEFEIIEVIRSDFFGPNGSQVVHFLTWWQSKWELQGTYFEPRAEFAGAVKIIAKFYTDRLKRATWPSITGSRDIFGALQRVGTGTAVASYRLWLKPKPKAVQDAWNVAYDVAFESGRVNRCRWLLHGTPALMALAVRDLIHPTQFLSLYASIDQYYPIQTLDSEVPPVLYKA